MQTGIHRQARQLQRASISLALMGDERTLPYLQKSNGLEEVEAWAKIRNSTAISGLSVRPWMVEPEYTAKDGSYSEPLKNTPTGM